MFKKLLIANRGEIACRIIKTAKKLGMHAIAVYSEADNKALHTKFADEAHCIGPAASIQSYLNINKIIETAIKTNADAIHPGYGFLAENPEFAEQCKHNNLIFVGPSTSAICAMGDKIEAKKIMETANVPVTPGYYDEKQDVNTLKQAAEKIGFPLLIKATAGGGGKGMRLVKNINDFSNALKSAKREAKASFGNDQVFLEKFIEPSRHIELQVFADSHGNVVHLFDRDCSIQRKHQKIIEEAPAPNLSKTTKSKMAESAVLAAKTINYLGAGTIEYLVDLNENYYFMEMNTRLQVEHPVTEKITGIDLVEWQLRIAAGEKLPLTQDKICHHGHAIEARIYAEKPDKDFTPSIGKLTHYITPTLSENVRVDSGFQELDAITPFYDSLISKLIVFEQDRKTAISTLKKSLSHYFITGVDTNISLLHEIVSSKLFQQEKFYTNTLDTGLNSFLIQEKIAEEVVAAAAFCYIQAIKSQFQQLASTTEDPNSPWYQRDSWRLNNDDHHNANIYFWINNKKYALNTADNHIQINSKSYLIELIACENFNYHISVNQTFIDINFLFDESCIHVFYKGYSFKIWLNNPNSITKHQIISESQLIAPMPGTIVDVLVSPNQTVKKGDKLIVIEAMKMEHALVAPDDGKIETIFYHVGDIINEGVELLQFSNK